MFKKYAEKLKNVKIWKYFLSVKCFGIAPTFILPLLYP